MSNALMEYLPSAQAKPPQHGADKYYGEIASGYNAKRENDLKWVIEQRIIEEMVSGMPSGSWVLDVPVGTGRFLECYKRNNYIVRAVDKSPDMLQQAVQQAKRLQFDPYKIGFAQGSVLDLGMPSKSVDAAVMCRLTRWLSPDECVVALKSLQSIAREKVIFTARVRNHQHARTYELIHSALEGWTIARDEAGADLDYRIIELRPA